MFAPEVFPQVTNVFLSEAPQTNVLSSETSPLKTINTIAASVAPKSPQRQVNATTFEIPKSPKQVTTNE